MTLKGKRVLVCGAGGFIGGHLVKNLISSGVASVRAVDNKPKAEWRQVFPEVENLVVDLSEQRDGLQAINGNEAAFAHCDGMARTSPWIGREMNQSSRLPHHAGVLESYATA